MRRYIKLYWCFCLALSLLLFVDFESELPLAKAQEVGPSEAELATARLDDLSSSAIYAELKARGINPLVGSSQTLRQAFVRYDSALGGGHNLNNDSENIASSAKSLNAALGQMNLFSDVLVRTAEPGARIRYSLVGESKVDALPQLSNLARDDLAIGIYNIWSERGGTATSTPIPFRIIKPHITLDLEEKVN